MNFCRPSALILLAAAAMASAAAPDAAASVDAAGRLQPGLRAAVEQGVERLDVIVHLRADATMNLPIAPRGVPQPARRLSAVERAVEDGIATAQERVPPGDLVIGQRFLLQPAFAARVTPAALEALLESDQVEWIEADVQWRAHTQQGKVIINADDLHAQGVTGSGYSVAVIDTGVDYNHATLGGGPIPNGKVVYGKDLANRDNDPQDCGTHGTAVASVIAGSPASFSGHSFSGGVAPGATIMAYKASRDDDCGSFSSSDVVSAIEDAILRRDQFNLAAINLSIGGGAFNGPCDTRSAYSSAIDQATDAGIVVVASAGNDGKRGQISAPACASNALSVGAVYDTRILGMSLCVNDDCSETCTDSSVPALTVTCYSNVNNYLDVFAPSEFLTAAEAGSGVAGFGGTSGAAPYASGAVALLFDAMPSIDAVQARLLLGLTGADITEPVTGVTRPLLDLQAAVAADDSAVGLDSNVAIPNGSSAATSSAILSGTGAIESVKVVLKVVHADPEHLRVTLTSPDGTTAVLHDHGPGTTPTGSIDDTLGGNGIYTWYPVETAPVESFDRFLGGRADGTWTLRVADDNPTGSAGISPRLVGWGLTVTTQEQPQSPTAPDFFIPVAVHAPGAEGTFWVSDLRLFNPSTATSVTGQLFFVPAETDGTQQVQQETLVVAPGSVIALADVIAQRFGGDNVQGNLIMQIPSGRLLATSRTYNVGAANGTYGQFIGMAEPAAAVGDPSSQWLLQLASTAAYRTNLGFSETTGAAAQVTVTLFDGASDAILGTPHIWDLKPWSNFQVNDLFDRLGAPPATNAIARVEVSGSGRVLAYASVVDRLTGDAIYVPGSQPVTASSFLVPIVAKISGQAGTNWVSDLRIYNPSSSSRTVQVEYRPEHDAAGSPQSTSLTVAPGRVTAIDDVLGSLFGLTNASGSLRLVPQGGAAPLMVTSRTYNDTGAGTYGQFIGAVTGGFSAATPAVVMHLESTSAFRSNLGIAETAGGTVTVRYVLKDASGETLDVETTTLGPFEVDQINNRVLIGSRSEEVFRVELFHDGGTGSFTAYGSVVDNASGDAIYVPAYAIGS